MIKKGLDLPITGAPKQEVEDRLSTGRVAVMADDFVGMRPTMRVQVGDSVKRGQLLFDDKKMLGVWHTSPGAGKVVAINRGARRALQSVVIELTDSERAGTPQEDDFQPFETYTSKAPADLIGGEIRALLVESGVWTVLRTRPFSRVPDPESMPSSIFVNAMDSNPLAASPEVVLKGNEDAFAAGLQLVAKLTQGKVFVCKRAGSDIPVQTGGKMEVAEFAGPHPSGLVGLHIHTLDPVSSKKTVWHLNYQDVVSIARLFATGRVCLERVIALGGPVVKNPRLLKTRVGACLGGLLNGEINEGDNRVISGSVLSGRTAMGEVLGYLGRYDLQVSALAEGNQRELFGWAMPGFNLFSTVRAVISSFLPKKLFNFTTSTNGSARAMVPIGVYERVMPMDIMPTFLLRALVTEDLDSSLKLGCLELDEEDLALCTFVCPGKTDYGPALRHILTVIEKEG